MSKKSDDTWLGFFKKTLKITGYTVIAIVVLITGSIGWFLYTQDDDDTFKTTYLKCEKNYLAFDHNYIYSQWDGLEEDWKIDIDITKKNKRVVEAEFNFKDGKGIYIIDRIKGTMELKNLTENKTLVKKTCERIVKSDLPESKEEPKF